LVLPPVVKDEDKVVGKDTVNIAAIAQYQGALKKELHAHLGELLEKGEIKPNRVERVPGGLVIILDALYRLRKDKVSGKKLVVRPRETV